MSIALYFVPIDFRQAWLRLLLSWRRKLRGTNLGDTWAERQKREALGTQSCLTYTVVFPVYILWVFFLVYFMVGFLGCYGRFTSGEKEKLPPFKHMLAYRKKRLQTFILFSNKTSFLSADFLSSSSFTFSPSHFNILRKEIFLRHHFRLSLRICFPQGDITRAPPQSYVHWMWPLWCGWNYDLRVRSSHSSDIFWCGGSPWTLLQSAIFCTAPATPVGPE